MAYITYVGMQWRRIAISDEGANEPGGAITRTLTYKSALTYISIGISIGTTPRSMH